MRTILLAIIYVIICIISIPFHLVLLIVRKINKKAAATVSLAVVKIVFNLCMVVSGCKKEIVGAEKIPDDRAVLYAANHRGFYDIILLYTLVPRLTAFIAKIEIKKFPCIAQWMYFLNCLFIDRGDVKQNLDIILKAIALAKDGYSIYIAPEGTRNPTDTLLEFKEGSMKIATKANMPIVPVCFVGTEKILEEHIPWVKKGKISVIFGDPIYPEKLDPEEKKHIGRYTRDIIQKMYDDHISKASTDTY